MLNLPATRQTTPADPKTSSMANPDSLAQAFECFTPVAPGAPEASYPLLQAELARLREELAIKNRDLARILAATRAMIAVQKRLEEKQESARRVQALAEMTALLAHEIRNPLGSLELFVGLIKEATRTQPEVAAWVVHVQAGLRALSAIVNNVLQFYTQAAPRTLSTDLAKLLAGTVEFLQPLALQRSMGVVFVDPGVAVLVNADPHRLQQVFFNLAINGFRAMSAGGRLTVRIRLQGHGPNPSVEIDFEDQGVGIAPANLGRIFEAGFTTNRGSPGLGLAVSKKVVAEHAGTLEVRSELGKGTTFTLAFPVARSVDPACGVGTCQAEESV
jgi:signal transduction histidine kinase